MGSVSTEDSVQVQVARLEASWEKYKNLPDQKNALFRAIMDAFRREFNLATYWNLLVACLQLSSPFILHRLITFIKFQKEDTAGGIMLVVTLVAT